MNIRSYIFLITLIIPITSFSVVPTYIESNTIENLCRKIDCHNQLNEYYKKYYYVKQFHKALAVSYHKSGNRYFIDNFGMSWQYESLGEAKQEALKACNKNSKNCEILLVNNTFHNNKLYEVFTTTEQSVEDEIAAFEAELEAELAGSSNSSFNIPKNAYKAGNTWFCKKGYKKSGNRCLKINIPENAYATNTDSDGWKCYSVFIKSGNSCIKKVTIPANAYASNTDPDGWKCRSGYYKKQKWCSRLPANALAYGSGDGFFCKTGYKKSGNSCIKKVTIPANAYALGDSWKCKSGYKKIGSACKIVAAAPPTPPAAEAKAKKIEEQKLKEQEVRESQKIIEQGALKAEAKKVFAEVKRKAEETKAKEAEARALEAEARALEAEARALEAAKLKEEAEAKAQEAQKLTEEEEQKKNQLAAERAAEKEAFEKEQYNRLLTQEVQAEQDLARTLIIEDQLNTLKTAYVANIAARVKSYWRYQGAEDDWACNVYVYQDINGKVEAVNIRKCNVDDSEKARAFKNSIERAVWKASPLPLAPDAAVFDKQILFFFKTH